MGASGWIYYCDHTPDLNAALATLRQSVFAKGEYYCPSGTNKATFASIQDLQEACAEDGTHSIIDIMMVAPTAPEPGGAMAMQGFSTVFPLPPARMQDLFGTDTPTRTQVAQRESELMDEFGRWQGCYVIFDDEAGKGICFAGHSGD